MNEMEGIWKEIQINLGHSTQRTKASNPWVQPSCIFLLQTGAPEWSYMVIVAITK